MLLTAEQRRAQDLRNENEALRQELAEANRIGETLEREHELIENRVHELALLANQAVSLSDTEEKTACQELLSQNCFVAVSLSGSSASQTCGGPGWGGA